MRSRRAHIRHCLNGVCAAPRPSGVTEAVLERLDELSRCCTPVDSPTPLVLLYSAASRRARAVEAVWTDIMQPGLPRHAWAVSVQCGRLLAPGQEGGRAGDLRGVLNGGAWRSSPPLEKASAA